MSSFAMMEDINEWKDRHGRTVAHWIGLTGDIEFYHALKAYGVKDELFSKEISTGSQILRSLTPVWVAIERENVQIAKILIELNNIKIHNDTILNNNIKKINNNTNNILDNYNINNTNIIINDFWEPEESMQQWTLLNLAAKIGDVELTELLLMKGASLQDV
eukprot:GHVL01041206.1.p1 GENE.GHVL01041206.1~~GHVL01041206.1.p1  ORF type:complete len:162 (-),score=52.62 GHVL01041206.1:36-521(-)